MAFSMTLLLLAAGVAMVLGIVGIYGVVAYVVGQRTTEIGVRLALGANPLGITASVLRQTGIAAGTGMLAGLVVAIGAGRIMESMLFHVHARDAVTLAVVCTLLAAVIALSGWLPARRAARLDPVIAMRTGGD